MKVLVTGAGGRIGFALCELLCRSGDDVRAWTLPGDRRQDELTSIGATVFEGDLVDPDTLRVPVRGVDVVCHLAAALTTHGADDQTFVHDNVVGTFNVLAAITEGAPDLRRVVYVSSDAVYWSGLTTPPLYLPIDEAHPLISGSVYGATKVAAEALCRSFWHTYDIPFSIARPTATAYPAELVDPSSPFGRRWFVSAALAWLRSRPNPSAADAALLEKLERLEGDSEQLFYLVDGSGVASTTMLAHPSDVAVGLHAVMQHPDAAGEAFNIGSPAPVSERALVELLADRLGLPANPIVHEQLRPSWYISSTKARDVVDYQPAFTTRDMVDAAVSPRE